jgi:hypothetical protein
VRGATELHNAHSLIELYELEMFPSSRDNPVIAEHRSSVSKELQ